LRRRVGFLSGEPTQTRERCETMSRQNQLTLEMVVVVGLVAAGVLVGSVVRAGEAPAKAAQPTPATPGERLVPLEIKLPRPLFKGTPKHIKPSPTLEKYTGKPRPPFYTPKGTTNLAANGNASSSDSAPIIGELSLVTDGDKEGFDGCFVELAPGMQWVQIDLGRRAEIYAILVWHYHAEGRVYHDVVVQVADDSDFIENVTTIYNNDFDNSSGLGLGKQLEYIEDYRGKLINAKRDQGEPVRGRYVRLYSRGNTSNDMNHYVEVAVYGKPSQ